MGYPFLSERVNLKPACLLLSLCLCHAGSAAALGLGGLSVHSYLGQPLNVTVTLLGATPDTTADCFSLDASAGSIAPPRHARLSLEHSGSLTWLHIRTPQPVNDPVAQFLLISDCEGRLQRDYVVLLDPPSLAEPALDRNVAVATKQDEAPLSAPAPRVARPSIRDKPPAAAHSAAVASRRPAAAHRPIQSGPPAITPHLVLSGKRDVPRNTSLALRFDPNLPDLNRPHPEGLTAKELSDENTALTRKLAYLESQLAALKQRNAELDAKRAAASSASTTVAPPPATPPKWPLYLLIIGLLAGAIVLIVWLSRRSQAHGDSTEAWNPSGSTPLPGMGDRVADPWTQPLPQQTERAPAPQRMPEIAAPEMIQSTEIKDDILDQAEVYMAHGHSDLAVHLLQEHLREAPTESPVPWLLLLDLLHRDGNTEGYIAASAECRRHFNVNLDSHPISQDNETSQGLEAYPHLLEQLVHVWNSPAIESFFNELIYDHRGGTRIGFEPAAYRDILLLRAIAQTVRPLPA
jgi:hypothetical protein